MKIYTNISGICICSLQSAGYQALYLVPKPIPTNRIIYLLQPRVSLCVNYVKSQVNFQMYSLLCSLLFLDVCCYCGVAGTRLKFHHLVNEIASDFLYFSCFQQIYLQVLYVYPKSDISYFSVLQTLSKKY